MHMIFFSHFKFIAKISNARLRLCCCSVNVYILYIWEMTIFCLLLVGNQKIHLHIIIIGAAIIIILKWSYSTLSLLLLPDHAASRSFWMISICVTSDNVYITFMKWNIDNIIDEQHIRKCTNTDTLMTIHSTFES